MRFNRSSATIPLPTQVDANAGENLEEFQSLKRDHSSSDSATISQMSSRRFQSLQRDHSSSDIAILFQPGLWMREFQSLKRDHSSSDLVILRKICYTERVSIAQARPFLFRLRLRICCSGQRKCFNRSSATIPLPTMTRASRMIKPHLFQSLKRDHSSSDAVAWCLSRCAKQRFQSLKRDHSSSDGGTPGASAGRLDVPIAQARPFLFRPHPGPSRPQDLHTFQSLKRDHSSSDAYPPPVESLSYLRFNRSSATIPLPTASFRKASRNVMN